MLQATIAALRVVLGADTAAFDKAMSGAAKSLNGIGKRMQKAGKNLSLFVTAPLVAAGVGVLKLATDATESENLFTVAMGDMADSARAFSEDMSKALGVNAFETRKTIATFFQMTTAMGISRDAALSMSEGMAQLTGDVASFFNLRPEDAFTKLQSAISGEIEPMRRLGVSVSETTVKQTLMNAGLIKGSEKLTEQQKILGRYITILDQTSNAQGDLARTLDSPANQMRILKSRFEEVTTELGVSLLPLLNRFMIQIAGPVVGAIQKLVAVFVGLSPQMQNIILGAAALTAAMGPLLFVFGGVFRVVSLVTKPLQALMAALVAANAATTLATFRVKWVGIAAALLGAAAAVGYFRGNWDAFKDKFADFNIFAGLGDNAKEFNDILSKDIVEAFKKLTSEAGLTAEALAKLAMTEQTAFLNAQADAIQRRIALYDQTRTAAEALAVEQARLGFMFAKGEIGAGLYARAMKRSAEQAGATWQQASGSIAGSFATIAGSFGDSSSGMATAAKAFGIAQATISVFTGMAKALELPFPANLAAVASVAAQGFAFVASIQSQKIPKFAHGGSFMVGGAAGVDNNLFAASRGERVDVTPVGQESPKTIVNLVLNGEKFGREQVIELARHLVDLQRDGGEVVVR